MPLSLYTWMSHKNNCQIQNITMTWSVLFKTEVVCVHDRGRCGIHMPWCMWGNRRITFESWSSPSIMDPGDRPKGSKPVYHAILLALWEVCNIPSNPHGNLGDALFHLWMWGQMRSNDQRSSNYQKWDADYLQSQLALIFCHVLKGGCFLELYRSAAASYMWPFENINSKNCISPLFLLSNVTTVNSSSGSGILRAATARRVCTCALLSVM